VSSDHRPRYHFLPAANWLNDPNGLIQWGDTYHLFYQYNPNGPFHGTIHWGHATSRDLLRWQHEPIALAPDADGPDAEGCWSGYAVDDGGVPTIIYSGHRAGRQLPCLATSDDGLRSWQKHPANPLFAPPAELDLLAFRDHTIWRENGLWQMLIGAGIRGVGGAALRFCSPDLRAWEYLGPLLVGDAQSRDPLWTGEIWECPDFFALDGQQVLIVSACDRAPHYSLAMVGSYQDQQFRPQLSHKLDYGDRYFYAPLSFASHAGRRIVFGWVSEGRSQAAQQEAGWSGAMSLPRELFINTVGAVAMRPIAELQALRQGHIAWRGLAIKAAQLMPLDEVVGDSLELIVEINPSRRGSCGLLVRRSPDGAEETRISYNLELGQLVLNRTRSSLDAQLDQASHAAPLTLVAGEPLRLHIYLDCSIIEVFANDRVTITSRIYPTRDDSQEVALFAEQGDAWVIACDVWQMQSIW
jgi:beta-fructofuranosidase